MDIGVPQGAVLSPTLFALYINDLITELNNNTTCYAFADDLVIVAKGEYLLDEAIRKIARWSRVNGIEINKQKSGILQIRKDRRTPLPLIRSRHGYPILENYKYLGVEIDDNLSLKQEL